VRLRVVTAIARLAGMLLAGMAGWQLGLALAGPPPPGGPAGGEGGSLRYVLLLTLAGAALGLLVTPYLTVVPVRRLWAAVRNTDAQTLLGAGIGLLAGLLAAALAAVPVSLLPDPFGRWLPTGVAVLLAWLGVTVGAQRKDDVLRATGLTRRAGGGRGVPPVMAVLDTSAIVEAGWSPCAAAASSASSWRCPASSSKSCSSWRTRPTRTGASGGGGGWSCSPSCHPAPA